MKIFNICNNKFCLLLILNFFIPLITASNKNFTLNETWEVTTFSIDGRDKQCQKCIPNKIKISSNGTKYMSFPRIYDDETMLITFAGFSKWGEQIFFEPWPTDEINLYEKESEYKLYSVSAFEISDNDTFYLLDQGRIMNDSTIQPGTSKLVVVHSNRQLIRKYIFGNNETLDYINSFFTDMVIDFDKKYAYITDSGFPANNITPSIIVLNLKTEKIYRILKNNTLFMPDPVLSLINNGTIINQSMARANGLNSIALTCDGENIILSSLRSRNIFSVSTKDIINVINKQKNYNLDILENITVKQGYKDKESDGIYISSKNNLYIPNIEDINVKYSIEIDNELKRLDFSDFGTINVNNTIRWPSAMDIHDGKLYLLDNHYNTFLNNDTDINYNLREDTIETINFTLFIYEVGNDEYSYKRGCTNFKLNFNFFSIVLCIWFAVILIIVLIFISISLGEDKKNEKDLDNKEVRLSDTKEVF